MATGVITVQRGLWELRANVGPFMVYYVTHQQWVVTEGKAGPIVRQKASMAEAMEAAHACEKYRVDKLPKKRPREDRGQGRKPLGPGGSVQISARVSVQDKAKYERLGGSAWLRRVIQQALDPDSPQPVRRFD